MTDQAAAPKAVKTLAEKLVDAEARVASLKAQIAAENALNNTVAGDVVTFKFGRKERARVLGGTVQAILAADENNARPRAVILAGEGADIQVVKVALADIVSNTTADERNAPEAEVVADETPAEVDPTSEA